MLCGLLWQIACTTQCLSLSLVLVQEYIPSTYPCHIFWCKGYVPSAYPCHIFWCKGMYPVPIPVTYFGARVCTQCLSLSHILVEEYVPSAYPCHMFWYKSMYLVPIHFTCFGTRVLYVPSAYPFTCFGTKVCTQCLYLSHVLVQEYIPSVYPPSHVLVQEYVPSVYPCHIFWYNGIYPVPIPVTYFCKSKLA